MREVSPFISGDDTAMVTARRLLSIKRKLAASHGMKLPDPEPVTGKFPPQLNQTESRMVLWAMMDNIENEHRRMLDARGWRYLKVIVPGWVKLLAAWARAVSRTIWLESTRG